MTRLLRVAVCCAALSSCQLKPAPAPPPMPPTPVHDAGVDRCVTWATNRFGDLQTAASAQALSIEQVTRVFEAVCTIYEEDGPDAAINAGLNAARNARGALVTDSGR